MPNIILVPLIPVAEELVNMLATPLAQVFKTSVVTKEPLSDVVDRVYDFSRAQYNSTLLIKELLALTSDPLSKILGITSVDLFVPVLTYVFGEAQLNGTVGVMSTHRLDDSMYGLPPDKVKFFERSLKEAVHELGHTFGLLHCNNFSCAMHASTTVEDVDVKGATLCNECMKKIMAKEVV